MTTEGTRSDFITQVRQAARETLAAVDTLTALQTQWGRGMNAWLVDAHGTPGTPDYEPGDFAGANEGLTKADVTAAFTTLDALQALLAQGYGTNLEQLR